MHDNGLKITLLDLKSQTVTHVGTIFVLASVALATALYFKGMFIFPHLSGPTLLAVIGIILLTVKSKASKPAK